MTPYFADESVTLHHGDCLTVLSTLPDASVDSVVTDPPYGLEFMGREWDAPWRTSGINSDAGFRGGGIRQVRALPSFTGSTNPKCGRCRGTRRGRRDGTAVVPVCLCADGGQFPNVRGEEMRAFQQWCELWAKECLRVLKPGGHLLAFGGTRTWHRLVCAIEDAGFEVRDSIAWLYGEGFPKSLNLTDENGARTGWGTALKPAHEPVCVARKPLAGTVAANVLVHGTGALNIAGCRVGDEMRYASYTSLAPASGNRLGAAGTQEARRGTQCEPQRYEGRWPANVILDEAAAALLDEQAGELTSGSRRAGTYGLMGCMGAAAAPMPGVDGDSGGASRFFYVAKANASERPIVDGVTHPTVKPLTLMRWLARLVTPPGGVVIDPFAGSGTTVEAAIVEGFRCIAIEKDAAHLPLIESRIARRRDPVRAVALSGEDPGLLALIDSPTRPGDAS